MAAGRGGLYGAIASLVEARGGHWSFAPLDAGRKGRNQPADDGNLHVVDNGRVTAPGYLNACTAYLEDYWHLDPVGVLAESSITAERFDPAGVDPAAAAAHLAMLRRRFVQRRRSRYGQARLAHAMLPPGAIAVFLQGREPYRRGHAHIDAPAMLRGTVTAAEGRPIIVKPHPLDPEGGALAIAESGVADRVLVTDANVHDVLSAAALTVSVNSAVAIEGFLHGVPALLCGQSDFAAVAEVTRTEADMPAAAHRAMAARHDYAAFLYWYFHDRCLWLGAPDLDQRILARFAQVGFPADRLGLAAPAPHRLP